MLMMTLKKQNKTKTKKIYSEWLDLETSMYVSQFSFFQKKHDFLLGPNDVDGPTNVIIYSKTRWISLL